MAQLMGLLGAGTPSVKVWHFDERAAVPRRN